jgi:hypothetical protein
LATSILLLCDGGGSNSSRYYVFKEALQALVNEIGIEIRIAHYPPYTSKYNPIEHRLFPQGDCGKAGSRVSLERGGKPTRAVLTAANILNYDAGH